MKASDWERFYLWWPEAIGCAALYLGQKLRWWSRVERRFTGAIDFTELSHAGGKFVGGSSEWQAYKDWCQRDAACFGCGKRFSDRPRDETGRCVEMWLTETDCGCKSGG